MNANVAEGKLAPRVGAHEMLSAEQLQIVRKRSNWRATALVLHAWGVIFAAMALFAWWPNLFTFLLAAAIIGARQLGLSILMHDGAHDLLLTNKTWNMRLSQWFCAFPTFTDTVAYRHYHLKHHAHAQQKDDPDLVLSAPFPVTRKSLYRKIFRDLSGRTGLQQRTAQLANAWGTGPMSLGARIRKIARDLGGPLAANAILFAGLALAGHWYLYPALWLVPLLTVYQMVLRIRNIAEHAMVPDDNDPFGNARTTLASPLERAFLAPYWVNYHVEHHLLMWVPCYNLPKFHTFLQRGPLASRVEIKKGYLTVLAMATSSRDDDGGGKRVHTEKRRYAGIVMDAR
ncbi:MAG: fatty acid desaturase family protein [Alphaproteobacteria bacterium]|nr:fatty acid desaturase family protein [Alphaproteobacteria bacterium]